MLIDIFNEKCSTIASSYIKEDEGYCYRLGNHIELRPKRSRLAKDTRKVMFAP